MTSVSLAAPRPFLLLRNLILGVLTLVCLGGCLEDKKAKAEVEQMQKMNKKLMKQLQEAQSNQAQQAEQMKAMQAEVARLKSSQASAAAAASAGKPAPSGTVSAPPPSPTGPAPKNLPYSLYTGVVSTTKGESVELTSVNFGLIDRIPLIINNGKVEVSMGKVRYLRRLGKFDETKKTFPVSVILSNGDEVRATMPVDKVNGVDPRFGSKVEIPFATVIEIEFKH